MMLVLNAHLRMKKDALRVLRLALKDLERIKEEYGKD